MVEVSVEGDRVVFTIEGRDRLWALRSRLEIPRAHVIDVEANAGQVGRWWHGPIVSLDHERYKKLILEVADPAATVARLKAW